MWALPKFRTTFLRFRVKGWLVPFLGFVTSCLQGVLKVGLFKVTRTRTLVLERLPGNETLTSVSIDNASWLTETWTDRRLFSIWFDSASIRKPDVHVAMFLLIVVNQYFFATCYYKELWTSTAFCLCQPLQYSKTLRKVSANEFEISPVVGSKKSNLQERDSLPMISIVVPVSGYLLGFLI